MLIFYLNTGSLYLLVVSIDLQVRKQFSILEFLVNCVIHELTLQAQEQIFKAKKAVCRCNWRPFL